MTITDFLLDRITEDQRHAEALWVTMQSDNFTASAALINIGALADPRKVIAECQAKRAIIAEHQPVTERAHYGLRTTVQDVDGLVCATESDPDSILDAGQPYPCPTIRHLTAVYANHPDYRDEWRVDGL